MKNLILSLLLFISFNSTFSQKFEGRYLGNFHQEESLININLEREVYNILILTSSGKSFTAEGKLENGGLNFLISTNKENEYNLVQINSGLNLEYTTESENRSDFFQKINIGNQDPIDKSDTYLHSELIGKWIRLGTYSSSGKIFEPGTKKKNYYRVFTDDGRLIEDPRYFRDNAQKNGFEFSYTDIPNFFWKVKSSNILITSSPGLGVFEEKFEFTGDSLIITTDRGSSTYFVREKK